MSEPIILLRPLRRTVSSFGTSRQDGRGHLGSSHSKAKKISKQ